MQSNTIEKLFNTTDTEPVYIIAEIGINHNGSLDTALRLIEAAKKTGVNAVKFQKRNLEKIYSKEILADANSAEWNFDYLIPILKRFELSHEDYTVIKKKCEALELDLIVTPFDEDSAEFVATLGVPAFKISSADMTNFSLIKKCAGYGVPLFISTGMWGVEEINTCATFYKKNNIRFAFLLANSTYPCPYESLSLGFIDHLKTLAPVVGYSGHERGIFIPIAAVALGAKIVEKHITFDREAEGPDHKASLLPDEFTQMVHDIRMLEKALGSKKEINQAEKLNKEVFAKSAVAFSALKKGHVLQASDVIFLSPGKGIFPHEIEEYYGRVLERDVPEGKYIAKDDFEKEILIKDWKKFNFTKSWGVKSRFHDFEEYKILNTPLIEFHCSETDIYNDFQGSSSVSQLVMHAPELVQNQLVDICSDDPKIVDLSIELLQKTIDKTVHIAKRWPAAKPKMVVHLGGMVLDESNDPDINKKMLTNAIKNFKRLQFSPEDIDILPENLPPRPWYMGGEFHQYGFMLADDLLEFCNYFKLGMTLDISHAALYCNYANILLSDFVRATKGLVRHVHISDTKGISGEGLQIGEGDIDFQETFAVLRDMPFSWVPEIWSGHLHNGGGMYQALRTLEKNYPGLF